MRAEHHLPSDGTVVVTLHFPRDGLTTTKTPSGVAVHLADLRSGGIPGAPCLPRKQLRVAMPSPMWPGSINILEERWQRVSGPGTLVTPAQRPVPATLPPNERGHEGHTNRHCSMDCPCRERTAWGPDRAPLATSTGFEPIPLPDYVPPNAELYDAMAETPAPIVQGLRVDTAVTTHIAVVEVSPVRMTKRGELELCTLVRVAIETVPKPSTPRVGYERAVDELKKRYPRNFDPARVIPRPEPFISNKAEAKRVLDVAVSHVINNAVIDAGGLSEYWDRTLPAEYLIITDDVTWDAEKITPGPARPGMMAAFEKLAQAKRARGMSAKVVSIRNIVAGKYGDAHTGARDLQEVIRRFLKLVREEWGVCWLLLGGGTDIVPVREVAGGRDSEVDPQAKNPPENGTSFWTGSHLNMNITSMDVAGSPKKTLVHQDTGEIIPYDTNGTSNATKPGWYFTVDDQYKTRTISPTNFVRVEGPPALVNAPLYWLWRNNMIPTDFYYSSLSSFVPANTSWNATPYVYVPPHDWDAIDNGLYGQETRAGDDLDGVVLHTDISVGRAPVSNSTEADLFVSKTLAYERLDSSRGRAAGVAGLVGLGGGNAASNWPRKMLLASADFACRDFKPTAKPGDTPTKGNQEEYSYDASKSRSLLKLKDDNPFRHRTDLQIFARISVQNRPEIWYKAGPTATNPTVPGWYYAKSETDPTPSVREITYMGLTAKTQEPIPTLWIVVHGSLAELTPLYFELRLMGADESMRQQEVLRSQIVKELPGVDRFDRYYEDEYDLNVYERRDAPVNSLSEANLLAGLNAAPHFVSLSGHGWSGGCCTLDNNSVGTLSNGSPGFIVYAVSCWTNDFPDRYSLGASFLNNPNGGAVAYVGNTRFGWIAIGDDYERAFFHALTATRHLGLLNDTRLVLNEVAGHYGTGDRWSIFSLNLLGDPELQVMVAGAQPQLHLRVPDNLVLIDDLKIGIIAYPKQPIKPVPLPDPAPLADALVHVRQVKTGKEWMGRTNAKGEVTVPKGVLRRGEVEITASKEGYPVAVQTATVEGSRFNLTNLLCCGLGGLAKKDETAKLRK